MLPQNLVVCNLFLLCAVSTHSSLGLKITIQPYYCYIRYLYTGFFPPILPCRNKLSLYKRENTLFWGVFSLLCSIISFCSEFDYFCLSTEIQDIVKIVPKPSNHHNILWHEKQKQTYTTDVSET